ncbi:MAG TPA: ribonuclease Y [Candidatus Dormibacteraeota bacterium]|nr:ribonuclease Y [Candidatus Dormibacteraeota bacterium]
MIPALIGLVVAVVIAVAAVVYMRSQVDAERRAVAVEKERLAEAGAEVEQQRKTIALEAKEEALRIRQEVEQEVRERRAEMSRLEQRATQREQQLERRMQELEQRDERLDQREAELEGLRAGIDEERSGIAREMERVAGLSLQEARGEILRRVESELDHEIAERIRSADERVREEAEGRAREILIAAIQRQAADQSGETSVTVVPLPSDEMKGRIIGREGRNIRALEAATGVDLIIDDTPEAVVLSGFDPVRREVARMALEKLFSDGRIHPARIEEMVAKSRTDMQVRLREEGEQACFEVGLQGVHPELVKLLGTLRYRTSYGQSVLMHARESALLAGMIAAEIGYDEQEAKEIALFHDIGKAVEHEIEGSHAVIGAEILSRLGRPSAIVHGVRAHHYDEEPRSVGAFIAITADAISAARPGARRETLASYIKRLERLEGIATEFEGVERAFAIQAGRELRVMVTPGRVDDDTATVLARKIANRIQSELTYPGQVRVTVLRETRSVEYAK